MANFNLNDYEEVKDRIKRFYADYPNGRIVTELVSNENGTVMFKAYLYRDHETHMFWTTGYAEETAGTGNIVNKTSHVENCETSAIGRALANAGYSGDKRPSREEMKKVDRGQASNNTPEAPKTGLKASEKQVKYINTLLSKKGLSRDSVKSKLQVESLNDLTTTTASNLIEKLNEMEDKSDE